MYRQCGERERVFFMWSIVYGEHHKKMKRKKLERGQIGQREYK